ncbi:MAG: DUF669 domain-containing protein [Planctomycetes bacterium]|nr:DUF669 domain-containing protein [Nannocystis sp.]MBA3546304.1 DUF669 domain-containing protein [Nannocystis sp.]MBA3845089.1 DUF669 domain-containing protein [Planctomycetota bacterium]
MASLNFDAHVIEPAVAHDTLPAGKYLVAIGSSLMKPTKNGVGSYLEIEYQVLDGEHKGRKLWSRHNLEHPNQQTVEIARKELSAVCRAVGVMTPKDSAELHNLPLTVMVKIKKRADNGEPTNEIAAWAKPDAVQDKPAQTTTTPPWLRR